MGRDAGLHPRRRRRRVEVVQRLDREHRRDCPRRARLAAFGIAPWTAGVPPEPPRPRASRRSSAVTGALRPRQAPRRDPRAARRPATFIATKLYRTLVGRDPSADDGPRASPRAFARDYQIMPLVDAIVAQPRRSRRRPRSGRGCAPRSRSSSGSARPRRTAPTRRRTTRAAGWSRTRSASRTTSRSSRRTSAASRKGRCCSAPTTSSAPSTCSTPLDQPPDPRRRASTRCSPASALFDVSSTTTHVLDAEPDPGRALRARGHVPGVRRHMSDAVPPRLPPPSRARHRRGRVVASGYVLSTVEWAGAGRRRRPTRAGDVTPPCPGRTLVVVELAGGNDGLNTVVPHADPAYHALRPTLGVDEPVDLDGQIGLTPTSPKLAARYKAGQVAIVEGVGYTPPNLSHFQSLAVWWNARAVDRRSAGWLGSYLDATVGYDDPLAAIAVGSQPAPGARRPTVLRHDDRRRQRAPAAPPASGPARPTRCCSPGATSRPRRSTAGRCVGQVERAVGLTVKARDRPRPGAAPGATPTPSAAAPSGALYRGTVSHSLSARRAADPVAARPPRRLHHRRRRLRLPRGPSATPPGAAWRARRRHRGVLHRPRRRRRPGAGHDDLRVRSPARRERQRHRPRHGEQPLPRRAPSEGRPVRRPTVAHRSSTRPTTSCRPSDFRTLYATGLDWLGVHDTEPVLGPRFDPVPALS